jgi:adenylosuccinate lyase
VIERYCRPEMLRAWSEERRLERWFEVELAVTTEREEQGAVPSGTTARLRAAARPDTGRMAAIEAECGHDVIAFLRMWGEMAGADARHLHAGMTSADLTDTALALQLTEAGGVLSGSVRRLRRVAWELAQTHRRTVMVGRTHGMHAEPITFGLKCLTWSEELGRDLARLGRALGDCAVGKLSGAVGTLAHLEPATEVAVLGRLGLGPEPVATQVVGRDRHAALLAAVAVLGGTMERIATEVRHLQRSEVREAAEPFGARQQGSSAMPHKRNPVRCERVCGLARLLRGHALVALEDQALWHERDISHSSVERVILPDAFLAADFMAAELAEVLAGLRVDVAAMRRNLDAGGGLVHSQRVLLALVEAGMARETAYRIVQEHALAALDRGVPFRAALEADPRVAGAVGAEALATCFDLEAHLRGVDAIFARAGEPEA